jgi:polar amino acid transport system substrate-binding protein
MKHFAICVLALIATAFNFPVMAKQFVIGVEANDYLPYWRGEGSQYEGYARDFFDLFAQHSGHTFQFKALPVKRLTNEFLEGNVDVKFPDNAYWAEDLKVGKQVQYSEPVAPFIDGVLVKPERLGKGRDALTSLSTLIGFTPWDYLDAINSGSIKLHNSTQLLSALKTTAVNVDPFSPCRISPPVVSMSFA